LVQAIYELENRDIVIFGNYIFSLANMRYDHPGGILIILGVRGREVDRYLYGMYTS